MIEYLLNWIEGQRINLRHRGRILGIHQMRAETSPLYNRDIAEVQKSSMECFWRVFSLKKKTKTKKHFSAIRFQLWLAQILFPPSFSWLWSPFLSTWSLSLLRIALGITSGDCFVCILSLIHSCKLRHWTGCGMPAKSEDHTAVREGSVCLVCSWFPSTRPSGAAPGTALPQNAQQKGPFRIGILWFGYLYLLVS